MHPRSQSLARAFAAALAAVALVALAAPALADVKVGDPAPDFALKDQDGKEVKLSSYAGKRNVLLAFYPRDFGPGCTNEMKVLAKENRRLESKDFVVLAVSSDPCDSHAKFAKAFGLQFKLLSDEGLAAAKAYGVFVTSPEGGFAARSVFLIDKEGKVRWLDRNYTVPQGSLEATPLYAEVEKLGAASDPLARLADLPSPEKEGKTVLGRYVQAVLREDATEIDQFLDPECGSREGDTPSMQRERRKALLDRFRELFAKQDLRVLRFEDALDLSTARVYTKDAVTQGVLTGLGEDARALAGRLAEGELLVVARTLSPKVGDVTVFPRELSMRLRRRDRTWRIAELCKW